MRFLRKVREDGISLRITHIIMLILSLGIMSVLIIETYRTSETYSMLASSTDEHIELRRSANDLMEASDYLTDSVQRFTVTCEREYMNQYFDEANCVKRRDKALEMLKELMGESKAYNDLRQAMYESVALMEREYYAMKLVVSAKEITDCPDEVAETALSADDEALSPEEKIALAQKYVHDEEYYNEKYRIRENMECCLNELETDVRNKQKSAAGGMDKQLRSTRVLIIIQSVLVVFVLWITSYLGINPILKGVQKIREDSKIPIIGSYEFRYLARTYNKMYEAFKKSISNLNYDASHDKLTGLYNRAGYDVLRQSVDLKTTAVLLIDADRFKQINDTYGHEMGDKVLVKIAKTLRRTFRSEDYICRLGGDEFLVFMIHMDEEHRELIRLKTLLINKELSTNIDDDDTPPISVSIGVAFGRNVTNIKELVNRADDALYKVKESGRNGCCFYEECSEPTE